MQPLPGRLEGPASHPDDYTTLNGAQVSYSPQGNGLTAPRPMPLEKVQLLRVNSQLFDLYREVAGGGPPAGPFPLPLPQGPPRLVHLEGEHVRVAAPARGALVEADAQGHLTGDPRVLQGYAAAQETHAMAEQALGRPVRFNSPDGKLTLSLDDPAASISGPAHQGLGRATVVMPAGRRATATDTDTISHEVGHALLDSQRPQLRGGAVHEAYADVTALTLSLRDPAVRQDVLERKARGERSNLASNIGEGTQAEWARDPSAPTPGVREGLRDLSRPGNALDLEPHEASRRYSSAIYDSILDVQARLRADNPKLSEDEALRQANQIVGGNALRSSDFLPPGPDATLEDLARATLKAGDRDQGGRYRSILEANFREAGLAVGGPSDRLREAGYATLGQETALPGALSQAAPFGPAA
ncbi:MAG: hypothetical protein AB1758_28520, partial [Candidatus Eremiobacterota bacterium]